MDLELDNIEEYDNDSYFDEMAEIAHPFLDDVISLAFVHLKEEYNLSDSMVSKLQESWIIKLDSVIQLKEAL